MTDVNPVPLTSHDDADAELRRGIELLYFAYRDFTAGPDAVLVRFGFGRAHHRALHFIARNPELPVSDLLRLLRITKQSLGRVLTELQDKGYVSMTQGREDRRQRLLALTPAGEALERELFSVLKAEMAGAYAGTTQAQREAFWQVLEGLVDPDWRADTAMLSSRR